MRFSRSHTGMLGIVSIFTGMIAPTLSDGLRTYPFPLTDAQWGAYVILALLVPGFYMASGGKWQIFRIIGTIILLLLLYLFSISFSGNIHNHSGNALEYLSWGWIFLVIGMGFLGFSTIGEHQKREEKITLFVDHIVGIVGSFTLLCLTILISYISYIPPQGKSGELIISDFFGSGNIEFLSGTALSPSFDKITNLVFDRKNGKLQFIGSKNGGTYLYPGTGENITHPFFVINIGEKTAIIEADGSIKIDGKIHNGKAIIPQSLENTLVMTTASGLVFLDEDDEIIFPGKKEEMNLVTRSKDAPVFAWTKSDGTGTVIKKNNEVIGSIYKSVESLALSRSGYDLMALVINQIGGREIVKNGVRIEQVLPGYVTGSYQSNGSHNIYITDTKGIKNLVYDGGIIKNQFEEIREIFLEKSGNSYAFFARPLGEKKYCLFTRYKGNLCGLDGYMNPRLGADGGSILYAGLKNSIWSIYRNTDMIIKDSKYHGIDVTNDYIFLDVTNPRQYLFIEKTTDGSYLYRKNGKILPGVWKDVSLDVGFGYDNKIITAVQDKTGWRIIEM